MKYSAQTGTSSLGAFQPENKLDRHGFVSER